MFLKSRRLWSALVLLRCVAVGVAQIDAVSCSEDSGLEWSFNSVHQSPCFVAASLRGVCAKNGFAVDPLPSTGVYAGPSGDDVGNICSCSTVAYSLMSACGACQKGSWGTWKDWSFNCTATLSDGVFPAEFIPGSTKVPHWAFQEVTQSGNWSLETAQSAGDTPENTSSASSPSTTASCHSSTGAIAGSAVGGALGTALVAVAIWYYMRLQRKRARAVATEAEYLERTTAFIESKPVNFNPADPTTFPRAILDIRPLPQETNHKNSFRI